MSDAYDLVIRDGLIVDGCGGEPFLGDVAVRDGLIIAVGEVEGQGAKEIDAGGMIVTPGFVDVHTHYDGQVTWENRLAPSSDHGVTTVLMGNCGVGFAPARQDDHNLVVKLLEGVEDIPEVVMVEGIPWNWETFPEYLDALDQRQADIDFATQLPHSPLRVYVMGKRGADLEPPTEADLLQMRRLTKEAIEAGALGVSTSRALTHRFRDGRPAPSVQTEVDELLALAGGLKDASAGVFQLIPSFDKQSKDEFAVIRQIAEFSGRPISFTFAVGDIPGGWKAYADGLTQAALEKLPIKGQFYPRPVGILFGLDLSYHPFSLNPSYKAIEKLPLAEKVAMMRKPEIRAQLLSEQPDDPNPFFVQVVQNTAMLFPLGDPPNYNPSPEDSIRARAARLGISDSELIYDELLRQDGAAVIYCPLGGFENNRFDAAVGLFGKPGMMIGLGDGGAHYGMICDAAYSTYILSEYVVKQKSITIQAAVSMMARETAAAVGLNDRGIIKPGYKADLNIIDLERLHLYAPRPKRDLPAGGRRLTQRADGYEATIVSGKITYRNGRPTGVFPGRLVRGAKQAPMHEEALVA